MIPSRRTSSARRPAPRPLRRALLCGIVVVGGACAVNAFTVPELAVLQAAPPVVTFGQGTITLGTTVERVAGADSVGPSITVRLTLRSEGAPLPDGSTVDAVFLLYEGAIWSTRLEDGPRARRVSELEVTVEGGPRWPPGERVDVVARVAPRGTQPFLVRAPDQVITGS